MPLTFSPTAPAEPTPPGGPCEPCGCKQRSIQRSFCILKNKTKQISHHWFIGVIEVASKQRKKLTTVPPEPWGPLGPGGPGGPWKQGHIFTLLCKIHLYEQNTHKYTNSARINVRLTIAPTSPFSPLSPGGPGKPCTGEQCWYYKGRTVMWSSFPEESFYVCTSLALWIDVQWTVSLRIWWETH